MGKGWASISCDRHGVRLEMWRSPMIWAQRTPEALSEPLRKIWLPCMEEGKQPSQIPGTPCEVCERGTSPHTDMTLWRSFRVRKDAMGEKAFCTNAVWERGVSTLEKINSIPFHDVSCWYCSSVAFPIKYDRLYSSSKLEYGGKYKCLGTECSRQLL